MKIDVCICTYKREAIRHAMLSIDKQVLPSGASLRLIVIDNDVEPTAKERVEATAAQMSVPVKYVHAPSHNISIARNAGLDAADADWIAIMDDDEHAAPNWIRSLLGHAIEHDYDVVFGPAIARYPEGTPEWILERDYLSTFPEPRNGEYRTGPTNNTLMRAASPHIEGRRFLLEKGRTGGEDTAFFFDVWRSGGRLGMCEKAIVYEDVDPARLEFDWLRQRKFRSGMTYGRSSLPTNRTIFKLALVALAAVKSCYCLIRAAAAITSPTKRNFWRLRGTFHKGVMSAFFGEEPELY